MEQETLYHWFAHFIMIFILYHLYTESRTYKKQIDIAHRNTEDVPEKKRVNNPDRD